MKKFRTIVSVIAMIIAEIGATMNNAIGGAILFSMIAGIACIVYSIVLILGDNLRIFSYEYSSSYK